MLNHVKSQKNWTKESKTSGNLMNFNKNTVVFINLQPHNKQLKYSQLSEQQLSNFFRS